MSSLEMAAPILGKPRRHSLRSAAEAAGMPLETAQRYWRSFGFTSVDDDALELTDSEAELLRVFAGWLDEGLVDDARMVRLLRLTGHGIAQLVQSQIDVVLDWMERTGIDPPMRLEYIETLAHRVLPDIQRLLSNAWRRQMATGIQRLDPNPAPTPSVLLGIGFADLVGYTELSKRLSEQALTRLIQSFEDTVALVVSEHGGTVIKTIGDEVLYCASEPVTVAVIACELLKAFRGHADMPTLRAGIAHGPVVRHLGDVFGTTVNLASRLTNLAAPGTIVAAPELAAALNGDPRFDLQPLPERHINGIGPVATTLVSLSGEATDADT